MEIKAKRLTKSGTDSVSVWKAITDNNVAYGLGFTPEEAIGDLVIKIFPTEDTPSLITVDIPFGHI